MTPEELHEFAEIRESFGDYRAATIAEELAKTLEVLLWWGQALESKDYKCKDEYDARLDERLYVLKKVEF